MAFFEDFKSQMPDNADLCRRVCLRVLGQHENAHIKANFSIFISEILDSVYEEYLQEQKSAGQSVIDAQVERTGTLDFQELDRFFLSLSQSRRSRAGKAFELAIEELLRQLGYPFSGQVVIEGAKPDYVLPSEEFFRSRPLDSLLLTAKRTLRERWRQVVTEANKSYGYFLATIDESISRNQLAAAAEHKIYVVVPKQVKNSKDHYRDSYNVITFEDFFEKHLDPAMARWGLEVKEPSERYRFGTNLELL